MDCSGCESHHSCCSQSTTPSVHQTIDELDFERGIWSAALRGDYEKIEEFLSRGIDPNERDTAGYTALHYSARNGHTKVCKLLVTKGADPNVQTKAGGVTPLHRAAYCGHNEIIEILLNCGANPLICDSDLKTPLHKAAECNHKKAIQLLLTRKEAPTLKEMKDKKGKTAMEYLT